MEIGLFIVVLFIAAVIMKKQIKRKDAQRKATRTKQRRRTKAPEKKAPALQAQEKGEAAEKELELALKRRLPKSDWYIFRNVTLKRNDDDGTTQVDLIAVSVFGAFVIEVKSLKGHVYANENSNWYLYSYPGSSKLTIQNPHRQNHAHVLAVAQVLIPLKIFEPSKIKPVVALIGDAKYKGLPENTYTNIDSLVEALEGHSEKVITKAQMAIIIGLIEHSRLYDLPETDQAHIEYLTKKHSKELDQNTESDCNSEHQPVESSPQPLIAAYTRLNESISR